MKTEPRALRAVAELFQTMEEHEIRYCHWKSNMRLDLGLQGRTDLDLLVAREHSQVFRRILSELDIKPVVPPPGKRFPAMEHYLGFDASNGSLFHLHVHYQLVLGEEFVKNYCLPVEGAFLDSVRVLQGVKIPAPELEIAILAIRILLKYRDRDALKDILSIRSPGIKRAYLNEIEWLLDQTSLENIGQMLESLSNVLPSRIVMEFLETVIYKPRAGRKLLSLRGRLRRTLSLYRRRAPLVASADYFREMWGRRKSLPLSSPAGRMTLPEGGMTLALVGVDGAGKSTLRGLLVRWLSWKLDVQSYYLGSKQPSLRSALLYRLFRACRRSQNTISNWLGERNPLSHWMAGLRDAALCAHYLSIGHDRYARYRASLKKVLAGSVVIFDRFPLGALGGEDSVMDGPHLAALLRDMPGAIPRALARDEQELYNKIRFPDYMLVLNVSPKSSLERKPDHRPAAIEAKNQVIRRLTAATAPALAQTHLIHLDADRPLEEVISQLKREVWGIL